MDRVLEGTLRAAEVLLSLTRARGLPIAGHVEEMENARRELALFQHHDGITGTAREAVVRDYIARMLRSIDTGQRVIAAASQALLLGEKAKETSEVLLEVVSAGPSTCFKTPPPIPPPPFPPPSPLSPLPSPLLGSSLSQC